MTWQKRIYIYIGVGSVYTKITILEKYFLKHFCLCHHALTVFILWDTGIYTVGNDFWQICMLLRYCDLVLRMKFKLSLNICSSRLQILSEFERNKRGGSMITSWFKKFPHVLSSLRPWMKMGISLQLCCRKLPADIKVNS